MPASKDRLIGASALLMSRNGYAATGVKAILEHSRTPYGSLYHFFPGGKEELGAAALREGGRTYLQLVESFFTPDTEPVAATRAFFEGAAAHVESTDFVDACPIATIAAEIASTSEQMRAAAAEAFESWMSVVRERLMAAGVDERRAREIAAELFCLIEGAFLLSRTLRDVEPIRVAGRAAAATVCEALG